MNFAGKRYVIAQPSFFLQHQSQTLFDDIIYKNRFANWITSTQCHKHLIKLGILSADHKVKVKELNKSLENYKLDLYRNFFSENKRARARKYIALVKDKFNKLFTNIHSLDHLTLDGYASICQQEFILINTVYYDDKLVFDNTSSFSMLKSFLDIIVNNTITTSEYRNIARNSLWRDYWKVAKDNPFPEFKHYTDEQVHLLSFSRMYDAVYENAECPDDDVINDDDALDGWFIMQQREIEDSKKQNRANKFADKHKNADELYIMADSSQDVERINAMNTGQGKFIKKQREAALKKYKKMKESQLPDRQMQQRVQTNEAFKSHLKQGK